MSNEFVPKNATAIVSSISEKVLIDFQYYRSDKCELKKISKRGIIVKILKFIMNVGKCQDNSELFEHLKANCAQDMSDSQYQSLLPSDTDMRIYEVWHGLHVPERIYYTRAGSTFYPVLFVNKHQR